MAKTKKLQKVSDFEKLETKKQIREYLEDNPDSYDDLSNSLEKRLNTSYSEKLGKEDEIMILIEEGYKFKNNESGLKFIKNATYEYNHHLITTNIHNHILANRSFPTIQHIALETGLSRTTIYRHLKNGLKTDYNALVQGKLEYMTTSALEKLYLIGIQDNSATALKSFIELSGAITKQTTTNVNTYIQVNNLRISKDEFDQLPNDTIIEIEKLISKNLTKLKGI